MPDGFSVEVTDLGLAGYPTLCDLEVLKEQLSDKDEQVCLGRFRYGGRGYVVVVARSPEELEQGSGESGQLVTVGGLFDVLRPFMIQLAEHEQRLEVLEHGALLESLALGELDQKCELGEFGKATLLIAGL